MTGTMKSIVLEKFGGSDAFQPCRTGGQTSADPAAGSRHCDQTLRLPDPTRDHADNGPLSAIIGHGASGVVEETGVFERVRNRRRSGRPQAKLSQARRE